MTYRLDSRKPMMKPFLSKDFRSNSMHTIPMTSIQNGGRPSISFFSYSTTDFILDLEKNESRRDDYKYKTMLLNAWEDAKKKKVFNYNLNLMYKFLDGKYNLSIQLNSDRGTMRRKPMHFRHIKEPFNPLRWNFTKLKPEEILFYLKCENKPYTSDPLDTHIIAINASPLENGHVLIVPQVTKCCPQVLNDIAIRMAVDLMLLVEDAYFHILYNSMLGHASINHLHLHGLFWPYESDLNNRKFDKLSQQVYFVRRPEWFIDVLAFQLIDLEDMDNFITTMANVIKLLIDLDISHNIFFSRSPNFEYECSKSSFVTAFLVPRRNVTGAKPPMNFSPASLELAGCLTAYTYHFFETVTEASAIRIVEEESMLSTHFIDQLLGEIKVRLEGSKPWDMNLGGLIHSSQEDHELTSKELEELSDSFQVVSTSPR